LEDTYVPKPGEALLVHAQDISVKKRFSDKTVENTKKEKGPMSLFI
jgi:hypothetical protein